MSLCVCYHDDGVCCVGDAAFQVHAAGFQAEQQHTYMPGLLRCIDSCKHPATSLSSACVCAPDAATTPNQPTNQTSRVTTACCNNSCCRSLTMSQFNPLLEKVAYVKEGGQLTTSLAPADGLLPAETGKVGWLGSWLAGCVVCGVCLLIGVLRFRLKRGSFGGWVSWLVDWLLGNSATQQLTLHARQPIADLSPQPAPQLITPLSVLFHPV